MERYIPVIIFIVGILFGAGLAYFLFYKEKPTKRGMMRNILIELLMGALFLIYAFSLDFTIDQIVYLIFGLIYISTLIIIAITDKQKKVINKIALFTGILVSMTYTVYISFTVGISYQYIIYLFLLLLLLLVDTLILKEKLKSNYMISILMLGIYFLIFTSGYIVLLTTLLTLVSIGIVLILKSVKAVSRKQKEKIDMKNIPILLFLSISNIIVMIYTNFLYTMLY